MASRKPVEIEGRFLPPLPLTVSMLERRLAETDDPDERAAIRQELVRLSSEPETR